MTDWLPGTRDGKLAMAADWLGYINTDRAAAWGIPAAALTELAALRSDAAARLAVAESAERTPHAVQECKTAFNNLAKGMRALKRRYFLKPPLEEADFVGLGLPVPDGERSPIDTPRTRPLLIAVRALGGFRVEIIFRDEETPDRRAIPYGMNGCLLFFTCGPERVLNLEALVSTKLMTKSPYILTLPPEAEGKFFSCAARWQSRRAELGPWSPPASVIVA